jgi:hypothetical protein
VKTRIEPDYLSKKMTKLSFEKGGSDIGVIMVQDYLLLKTIIEAQNMPPIPVTTKGGPCFFIESHHESR